jgi:hypothetical protein
MGPAVYGQTSMFGFYQFGQSQKVHDYSVNMLIIGPYQLREFKKKKKFVRSSGHRVTWQKIKSRFSTNLRPFWRLLLDEHRLYIITTWHS